MGRDDIKYPPKTASIGEGTKNSKSDCFADPRDSRNFLRHRRLVVQVLTNQKNLVASVSSIAHPKECHPKCGQIDLLATDNATGKDKCYYLSWNLMILFFL